VGRHFYPDFVSLFGRSLHRLVLMQVNPVICFFFVGSVPTCKKRTMKTSRNVQFAFLKYRHLNIKWWQWCVFVEIIPGGSLAFMCCKIKPVIDREQKKAVWIPASSSWWDSAITAHCHQLFNQYELDPSEMLPSLVHNDHICILLCLYMHYLYTIKPVFLHAFYFAYFATLTTLQK